MSKATSAPTLRQTVACALLLSALWALHGCTGDTTEAYSPSYSDNPPSSGGEYVFAPHPLLNPQKMAVVYGAVVDLMNARLAPDHIRLRLEASSSYSAFNEKLRKRLVQFALPNPYQTVLATSCGYIIIGKAANDEDFRGIVLVRRDNPSASVRGLKGAAVAFPAPTALAATMLPELYLKEHGLDPRRDITQVFAGTHESALMNVSIGSCAAACTWPPAWKAFQRDRPDLARLVEVRWQTDTLPSNGLVASGNVPENVRRKVAEAFFALADSPEGARALQEAGVNRLVPADGGSFRQVRAFIARYERTVRTLGGLNE